MTGTGRFYIHTVLFALGTAGAQFIPVLIPAWSALAAGAVLAPCACVPALRPAAVCLAGLLWALFRADLLLHDEWPSELEGRDATIAGMVAGLPERGKRYLMFDLDVERARFDDAPVDFQGRVRLRWYDPTPSVEARLKAGSRWRLKVRLKQPHGYYNPGGFDYEAYLYRKGVRARGYVREDQVNARLAPAGLSLRVLRQKLSDRLGEVMQDVDFPGLLRALTLGDRSSISNGQWETLRATGTNHLMAISGLHVGFAAGVGALLGTSLGRVLTIFAGTMAAPRVGALAALFSAFVYAALSGFGVPAQRAFIMAAVLLLGMLCRRHTFNARGLCLALVVVLVVSPASVLDPGLWLSFCAVGMILGWLARTEHRRGGGRIAEAVKLQCFLSIALLPLVAAFFGLASLVSAPANLIAVPVVMFGVVPLCLASVASAGLGLQSAAGLCLELADVVLAHLWPVLTWLAGLDYASIPVQLDLWQSLALMGGVAWIVAAPRGARRWGVGFAAVLLAPGPQPPEAGDFRVAVLDVGQGLSVVVTTERHVLVYDTGPRYPSGFSLADAVVTPYLRSQAVEDIDVLIISHGDNDHRGGYEDLVAQFDVGSTLSSVAPALADSEYCVRGQKWRWDGVAFEILHPEKAGEPAHNNASCVLRIQGRYGSMLLTGDIETRAEYALERREGDGLRSSVLLVPHQGSTTSSTQSFIDRVEPARAIVSAGYVNRYGHPRPEIVARYRRRGIELFNTASAGAVIADFTVGGIRVRRWRDERPRYWLDRAESGILDTQFDRL